MPVTPQMRKRSTELYGGAMPGAGRNPSYGVMPSTGSAWGDQPESGIQPIGLGGPASAGLGGGISTMPYIPGSAGPAPVVQLANRVLGHAQKSPNLTASAMRGGLTPTRMAEIMNAPRTPNAADHYMDRLRASRGTPGQGLLTNEQAADPRMNGYVPHVTVGGAFGQRPVASDADRIDYRNGVINGRLGNESHDSRYWQGASLGTNAQGRPQFMAPDAQVGEARIPGGYQRWAMNNYQKSQGFDNQTLNDLSGASQGMVGGLLPVSQRAYGSGVNQAKADTPEMLTKRADYKAMRDAKVAGRQGLVTQNAQARTQARRDAQAARNAPPDQLAMLAQRDPRLALQLAQMRQSGDLAQQQMGLQAQGQKNDYEIGTGRNKVLGDQAKAELARNGTQDMLGRHEVASQYDAVAESYRRAGNHEQADRIQALADQMRSGAGPQGPALGRPASGSIPQLGATQMKRLRDMPSRGEREKWLKNNTKMTEQQRLALLDGIDGPSLARDASRGFGGFASGILGSMFNPIIGEFTNPQSGLLSPSGPFGSQPQNRPAIRGKPTGRYDQAGRWVEN